MNAALWGQLNWLDILLLVILVVSVITSVAKGFSRELIGLAALVGGLILGLWFYGVVASFFAPYLSSKGLANLCGFLLVFFGTLMLGALLSWGLRKLIKAAGVSWMDRLLGGLFGFARATVIAVAIVMSFLAFAPGASAGEPPQAVIRSQLAPYVVDAARVLTGLAPRELKDEFRIRYEQVQRLWKQALREGLHGLPPAAN